MCARDGHFYYHRYITLLVKFIDAVMYLLFLRRQHLQNYLFLDTSFFHGNFGFSRGLVISYSKEFKSEQKRTFLEKRFQVGSEVISYEKAATCI